MKNDPAQMFQQILHQLTQPAQLVAVEEPKNATAIDDRGYFDRITVKPEAIEVGFCYPPEA